MAGVEKADFDSPDESRTPDKTRIDVVHLGSTTAARFAMEPGWRWSEREAGCRNGQLPAPASGRRAVGKNARDS